MPFRKKKTNSDIEWNEQRIYFRAQNNIYITYNLVAFTVSLIIRVYDPDAVI